MGMLDQMSGGGQPQRRGGVGQTVAAGVVLALLIKAVRMHQAAQARPQEGTGATPPAGGSILGNLGSLLGGGGGGAAPATGGAGLGGMLAGLGGAGALGGLLGQLKASGLANEVNSWVSTGANQPVNPQQLEQALGPDAINELQQQTGIPRDQLMSELAHHLPEAVSEATPQGRLPDTDDELHQTVTQPPVAH